jgi:hypothetical protein
MIAKEIYRKIRNVSSLFSPSVKIEEETNGLKGKLILKGYENGKLVYDYASPNVIVNSASILIARLLKDSSEPSGGITFLSVGTGDGEWDIQDPPAPTTSQTKLEGEVDRKAISSSNTSFIDPNTGDPVGNDTPTNIVDYAVTFSESEAVGAIVEMGLFGGDATEASDSGTMLNYRTFPVINKTNSMTLSVIFRITA